MSGLRDDSRLVHVYAASSWTSQCAARRFTEIKRRVSSMPTGFTVAGAYPSQKSRYILTVEACKLRQRRQIDNIPNFPPSSKNGTKCAGQRSGPQSATGYLKPRLKSSSGRPAPSHEWKQSFHSLDDPYSTPVGVACLVNRFGHFTYEPDGW